MSAGTLHPRLAELVALLAETRAELLAAMAGVPAADAARRPRSDAWSVAEIAEHLRLVEDGIGRTLGSLAKQADPDALGPETETASVLGALDRYRVEERRSRVRAPEPVRPGDDPDLGSALRALGESRRGLLALIERVNGLALGRLGYPHPLLGPLSFYEWLLFLGQHERRHAAQARDVMSVLRGIALAAVTTLAAASPAPAQGPSPALPYESMARRIVAALQPAKGERAILRTDSVAMPELVPPLRTALEQAGVDVALLGFGPGVDLKGEIDRSTIYVWLPLAPATAVPPPEAEALGQWLDSGRGRQIHFHWTGITTGTDGLPVPVPANFDRLHVAALDANEGALRHRL
ncbi:MAG: DinB family protein, partial [Gemmatimonadales bacterium]